MAMVTLPEQHRTPAIQLPHGGQFDCGASPRQCRFFALDGGVSKVSQDTNNVSESTAMMVDEGMGEVAAAAAATAFQVPFGAKSTKGRRPNMEDCDTVVENFTTLRVCCYPKEGILPEALQSQVGVNQLWSSPVDSYMSEDCSIYSESSSNGSDVSSLERCNNGLDSQTITSTFQYAAVFDGHGGSAVSIALSKKLHLILRKELEGINSADGELTINHIASGMKNSFITMDSQLGDEAKTAGSTGVVSLISGNHIIVANCGDSRAVLCRQQQAFKLSRDHKPSHPDEQERVVRAGGKVCNYNGIRVMGLLAMTRAFGDHCLSNFGIIAEPEVTVIERHINDEFVILASDGLWDVVSDMEACALASRCFMRAQERNVSRDTAARVAASVLMRVALDKGSSDNITVVVLDLRK